MKKGDEVVVVTDFYTKVRFNVLKDSFTKPSAVEVHEKCYTGLWQMTRKKNLKFIGV